ncbi:MAG: mechanosensitive ion channel family protein [Phycisphaerales bacterium]|nr:mechanosensitive ion channel family protein [Phycisphaerales bacterium]
MQTRFILVSMALILCWSFLSHEFLLAEDVSSVASDNKAADVEAPGEAPAPKKESDEDHPWTIVEKTPPFENSRQSVKPEKLDSPRSLMWSLGRTLNTYRDILDKEGRTYDSEPRLQWIQSRIAQCFDLSDVGPEFQNGIATDSAVYLREVMRRIPMAAWETIPDRVDINNMSEEERITRYRFDSVPIELMMFTEGERAGEWILTIETRDTARAAFEHVQHITPIAGVGELYQRHFFTPGWLIPASWINNLPRWMGHSIFEEALWQWAITLIALMLLSSIVIGTLLLLRNRCSRPLTLMGRVLYLCYLIMTGVLAAAFIEFLELHVFLSGSVLQFFTFFCSGVMLVSFVLGLLTLGVLIAEIIISSPRINPRSLDAALIRVAARTISILLAAIVLFQILSQLGLSPTTLLAGAGVTGLAIALAAQDTLKNFFASIILLMERPFREGERIRIGDDTGTVETIGLRSTCIRTRAGNLVSLPNETVAHGRIENISRRPHIRNEFTIGLVYSTTTTQIEKAVEIITNILEEKTKAPGNFKPFVFFTRFDDSSLAIECTYWQSTTNFFKSQQTAQAVNLAILDQFKEAGIEFAYPTLTVMTNRDTDSESTPSDH